MSKPNEHVPGFWSTVRLLLGATQKRSAGRRKRQEELLHNRAGANATNWGGLGYFLTILLMAALNVIAAFVVMSAVTTGERVEVERRGKMVVSQDFLRSVKQNKKRTSRNDFDFPYQIDEAPDYGAEAKRIAEKYGGSPEVIEARLRDSVQAHSDSDLVSTKKVDTGLNGLPGAGRLTGLLGSAALLWWAVMIVFQGEGLELDIQRRRHPMWEWLFSHPVPPGAIFLAEMLSPIAANPIYWSAPFFAGILYGTVYGFLQGMLAAVVIGIPITMSAACLGKALENAVVLRLSARSRGAVIGIMGWLGYASTMLFFVGLFVVPKFLTAVAGFLEIFTAIPWPWLRLFLGGQADGTFSFLAGIAACWIASAITIGAAIWFSVWSAQQGLSGNLSARDSRPSLARAGKIRFGKEPLYRKELLWFIRDRSAIVQVILIPLTVAGLQAFNLRGLLNHAQGAWNYLSGVAILFGTYFLWILGPKSLQSEGSALWIAQTWPRGLDSLLKAKAWLWSLISCGPVALVLAYAAYLFPGDIWKIVIVAVAWFFFARSMAEKSVTLVTVVSSSGEVEKVPSGRRWAAQLGMLTFCIGILTQQWHVAIMGIVYSYITAAAMWQNFRARLPFLFDPWSETLPPPPTLMHAMVSISILVELGAVVAGVIIGIAGRDNAAIALALSYGICSVIVFVGASNFMSNRGVLPQEIWRWLKTNAVPDREPWWRVAGLNDATILPGLLMGASGGLFLGLIGRGYVWVLAHLPATEALMRKAQEQMTTIPNLRMSYIVMAVFFAPFAEEYLFRGLLYRALDREWGGWSAILGSAAFFAIYHPPLAWVPVFLLGTANAILFKKTRKLAPAILLHMLYNAVVLF